MTLRLLTVLAIVLAIVATVLFVMGANEGALFFGGQVTIVLGMIGRLVALPDESELAPEREDIE